MHILISNDDGYQAPGLTALANAIRPLAGRITVIAPEQNQSASSNSLTLQTPLRVNQAPNGFFYVNGTPTDCVHLAITGLLDAPPTMVISGVNAGPNLGDDVLYSGTVAAAMEGRFLGSPAIAVSCYSSNPQYYATAARVAQELVRRLLSHQLPSNVILNVNVPDVPWEELAGWKVTRLGSRHKAEQMIRDKDPHGRPIYWIGPPGSEQDAGPDTDFFAVNNHYVSITPLDVDLTHHSALKLIGSWLEK